MRTKLKICFFGTYDKTYTSNKLILQGLRANGVSVLEINAHTKVTRLDKKDEMNWLNLLGRAVKKVRLFTEVARNFSEFKKVDAIYVGYPGHLDVLLAYPLAKLFGKKLVFNPLLIFYTGFVEEQGILDKDSLLAKIIKFGETTVYNSCDLVLADTPFQEEYLKRDFRVNPAKLKVLPIGADDVYYAYTPYVNKSKKIRVVYYGLYSPIHGVKYLVEAARFLRKEKDIEFVMVGNGNTFQKNYDNAKKLKLTNIKFYHDTPEDQHVAILQTADIFPGFFQKHPTVDRVIPNKVYQGMALGKVVLTADAPVIRSAFVNKETIYTVKPADAGSIARAILELKNDPALRYSIAQNSYKLYKKKFTSKAVGKELKRYIEKII